jgi:hypothetical protein
MKDADFAGKAKPFRKAGRQSREEHSREQLIWTASRRAVPCPYARWEQQGAAEVFPQPAR